MREVLGELVTYVGDVLDSNKVTILFLTATILASMTVSIWYRLIH